MLKNLLLNDNKITDAGAEKFVFYLHKCKDLNNLSVANNRISDYSFFKRRLIEKHPNKRLVV